MTNLFELPRRPELDGSLSPQQRASVSHGDGPLLVVAGAGTGKTRVITERIRYLLDSDPALAGESILGLTFTDKAAGEMKRRVIAATGERGKKVWLGTFHSFCHQAILREADPTLQVLDEIDHWILLRRNMPRLGMERYRRLAEPGQFLGDFVEFLSRCQDELVTPDDYQRYADGLEQQYLREKPTLDPETQRQREEEITRQHEIARVYRASEELLHEQNCVTFGRQLVEAVRVLKDQPKLLERLEARFRYILVDEFQDTNIAQLELLWLLANRHRNILAVGDDDQAIYRFRGASFGSFKIFLEKFAVAGVAPGDLDRHVQPLTQNYRSSQRILRVAGQVIAQNPKSPLFPEKRLTTANPSGERIRIVEFSHPRDEADWVAAEIERLRRTGLPWKTFTVLYRKHNHRDLLVPSLRARDIPFVIKNLSILNHTLVRDLVAYLRLIAVPSDNVACARVLAIPAWGFEPADLVRLCERASRGKGISLWQALEDAQGELAFARGGKRTADFVAFISQLRERARQLRVADLFSELAAGLELPMSASAEDNRYVDRFARFTRDWEAKSTTGQVAEFLQYLEYFEQAGGSISLEEEGTEDVVQLMTVHAAKGLEFDHVFVIRLAKGAFPVNPQPRVLEFPEALLKEEKPLGDFHIQEERRLFYVALTRARKQLTLTTVENRRSRHSVFLDDILMNMHVQREDVRQLAPLRSAGAPKPAPTQVSLFDSVGERARVYSRIAQWAETYRPPAFEPLRLSASAIDTYKTCPQKYLFHHVWGIRGGPQAATSFGSVMHTTIKHLMGELRRNRRIPPEEVEAIFLREWTSAGFEDTYQEEEYKRAGLEQLRAFCGSCFAAAPEIVAQERSFALPLTENLVITGRIDQVNRLGPGEEEIVDYKTGKPKGDLDARRSLQLSIYALAARELLDFNPARLVFYNLRTNDAVATTRDATQLNVAREEVLAVAADIRAGQFAARPGFICRSCEFQQICPAHEQAFSAARPEKTSRARQG